MIKEIKEGRITNLINESFLVYSANLLETNQGRKYWSIILQDADGQIDAKKWDIEYNDEVYLVSGNVITINADVNKFKDNYQLIIREVISLVNDEELIQKFIPQSKYSKKELEEEYNRILNLIKDDEYKLILNTIYNKYYKDIFDYPAAVRNHHNYQRGLITHSISMAQVCEFLSNHYSNINKSLLLCGALLHDLGKIVEFSGAILTKYTNEGKLLGHISIGFALVKEVCDELKISEEKAMLLQHIILSHHGKMEFGSPVLPQTKEAILLSMVDDMDAKMELCDSVLSEVKKGEYSNRIFALDDRSLYNPKD